MSLFTAAALLVAAGAHAAMYGLGQVNEFIRNDDGTLGQNSRVLTSPQAMLLLIALCGVLGTSKRSNRRLSVLISAAGVITILASQQRTVWVALAVVTVVIWVRSSGKTRARGVAVAVAVIVGAWVLNLGGALQFLSSPQSSAVLGTGTYDGRVAGWRALTDQAFAGGLQTVIAGRPFGSGFGRYEGAGLWVTYAPHNFYVTLFVRVGLLGLVLFLWVLVAALRRSIAIPSGGWITAMWSAIAVVCWTYTLPWFLIPLAAICLAQPMVSRRVSTEAAWSSYRRPSRRAVSRA